MAESKATERYVVGWALDRDQRENLLRRLPPMYVNVIADHVTLAADVGKDYPLPTTDRGEIIGAIDDAVGLQAMVVRIGGAIGRPDGSTYHITWSLDRGRKPVESNDVIRRLGWRSFAELIPIRLQPTRFPF